MPGRGCWKAGFGRSGSIAIWAVLVAAVLGLAACAGRPAGRPVGVSPGGGGAAGGRVPVVATFYPLAFMAGAVGGDRVEVTTLVPPGTEPHDWEPRPSHLRTVERARVFIYNGAGFEPWVDRLLQAVDKDGLIAVNASAGIDLLPAPAGDGHEHGEDGDNGTGHNGEAGEDAEAGERGHDRGHDQGAYDPHVWVDPLLSQQQVRNVAEALARADPASQEFYRANAERLIGRLRDLERRYQELASCPRREIVVTHAFFTYPARRYGLEQIAIYGGSAPDAEPTPRQMAELVRFIRSRGIRHIFVETLVSDRAARALAAETGAQILVLHPLEGLTEQERVAGKDYLSLMEQNLANLRLALGCEAR